MPFRHKYQTYEVRRLLQQAENQPSPITAKPAHSRGLHAGKIHGGEGASKADMMTRTHKQAGESNRTFKNRGGAVRTSTFKNLIQQSDAACQALNSPYGQAAMGVLDIVAHANKSLRVTLTVGPIREAGFLRASAATPMKTVHKTEAAVRTPAAGAGGVMVIIDRVAGQREIHIQTCYPVATLPRGCSYVVQNMATRAQIARG